jgi:hypothetical protein
MNTTTIMLQHDVTIPGPHVDNYMISGKAIALHYPLPGKAFIAHDFLPLTPRMWSVRNQSNSIVVTDLTRRSWKMNQPLVIKLEHGGNTKAKV